MSIDEVIQHFTERAATSANKSREVFVSETTKVALRDVPGR